MLNDLCYLNIIPLRGGLFYVLLNMKPLTGEIQMEYGYEVWLWSERFVSFSRRSRCGRLNEANLARVSRNSHKVLCAFCCSTQFLTFLNTSVGFVPFCPCFPLLCVSSCLEEKLNLPRSCWCLESKQTAAATKVERNPPSSLDTGLIQQVDICFPCFLSRFTDNCSLERTLSRSVRDPRCTRRTRRCTHNPNNEPFCFVDFLKHNASPWS